MERGGSVEHNEYITQILNTGFVGQRSELDDERRALYEEWLADEEIVKLQANYEIERERREARIAASENPDEAFAEMFRGDLPPIHEYRVDFDLNADVDSSSLDSEGKSLLKKKIRERKQKLKQALKDGFEDNRRPLDEEVQRRRDRGDGEYRLHPAAGRRSRPPDSAHGGIAGLGDRRPAAGSTPTRNRI